MTRYIVAAPATTMTVTGTGEECLVINLPSGNYMVPMAAFDVDRTPAVTLDDVANMNMHGICSLIDHLMRRAKQLEIDLRAAELAGYVKPAPVERAAAEKPAREYKPLDHGPREAV